jgi:hypothetical protein
MQAVVTAADKLKLWDARWRRVLESHQGDYMTMLLLSLIAVEGGTENLTAEKNEFKKLQTRLEKSLHSLLKSESKRTFESRKMASLTALAAWSDFAGDAENAPIGLRGGRVGLREDLLASEQGEDDIRSWILHPARTTKRIAALQFVGSTDFLKLAINQVWAMEYDAHNFSDSKAMVSHIKRLTTPLPAPLVVAAPSPLDSFSDIGSLLRSA